ncbi:MAG: DUF3187 family protein [Deltaproteobacteria bacterium]|nr:DUF3187 family protein [Deltaproteobacteria bacterium]
MNRLTLALCSLIALSPTAIAEELDIAAPYPVRHQHPLALTHYSFRPEAPQTLTAGSTSVSTSLAWSNTYNSRGKDYLMDVESRVWDTDFRYAPLEGFELSVLVPLVWRGGGALDSLIKEWDATLGVPNAKREDAADDQYSFFGQGRDGEPFTWEDDGTRLGNVQIGAKAEVLQGEHEISTQFILSLPTSAGTSGAEGVDVAWGVLGAYDMEPASLYWGANVSYFTDHSLGGVKYHPWHGSFFAAAGMPILENVGATIALVSTTQLVENIPRYPDNDLYLDVSLRHRVDTGRSWGVLVRENPLHPRKTTDVTLLVFAEVTFR